MSTESNVPYYLADEFSMYLENMESLKDPENPDLLSNYLADLFKQLKAMPLLFVGMVDQLAMAITTKIKLDSKSINALNITKEPLWQDIKPFVSLHADARACITEIMTNAEQDLKNAILLIHFYNCYDPTPLEEDDDNYDQVDDSDNDYADSYDENY